MHVLSSKIKLGTIWDFSVVSVVLHYAMDEVVKKIFAISSRRLLL